jgi:hypothetical protein
VPLLRDRVVILRAPLISGPYGSTERDWPNATQTTVTAEVQPLSSSEDVVQQERTLTRFRVILPATAPLVATDRVRWRGADHEVDGEVEPHTFRGVLHHQEAVLQRVAGG